MRNSSSSSNILLINSCYAPFKHCLFERNSILLETVAFNENEAVDTLSPELHRSNIPDTQEQEAYHVPGHSHTHRQVLRFGVAGGLNTLVDVLILNGLLWFFPTTSTLILLAYNSLAYSIGAINSFLLNKYWTFGQRQRTTRAELVRFTLITLCGIGWSSSILWLAGLALYSFLANATVWANASKLVAIAGTALISYLGMRLWVFVSKRPEKHRLLNAAVSAPANMRDARRFLLVSSKPESADEHGPHRLREYTNKRPGRQSL
jgi:putative flippase GtrA